VSPIRKSIVVDVVVALAVLRGVSLSVVEPVVLTFAMKLLLSPIKKTIIVDVVVGSVVLSFTMGMSLCRRYGRPLLLMWWWDQ
jgi:hypothetical protein